MKYLLIDTTTSHVVISIVEHNEILVKYEDDIISDMSSKILPIIKDCFDKVNFTIKDLDKIFVVNGPGSFTGIRIGVAIAKTLAWSLKKDIIPISKLELMATTNTDKKYLVPMIDARRDNVFAGIYDNNLNSIKSDSLININELLDGLDDNYELLSFDLLDIKNLKKPKLDILKIILKHQNDKPLNPHALKPNYLKLTQAEENIKKENND